VERTRVQRANERAATEIQELNTHLLKELAQKDQLASLGQASAEFVHDFANPLTIVGGYVQLLAKKLERSEDGDTNVTSLKDLRIIEQNVQLCRELLTMWQSYGTVGASPHKPTSVSIILREVIGGVGAMAVQNGVELKGNISDEACIVLGDAVQIKRAIQNVIVNAVQACAEKRGMVSVDCRQKDFYVDLHVEDNGHGIPPARISKIFDPYFTTKQGKSGTGLGLYITKKVVEDHKGSLKVESTPGVGTTFFIRLPLHTS
jgi:signal transduction histidine kinase